MEQNFKNYKIDLLKPIKIKQRVILILVILLIIMLLINLFFSLKIRSKIIVFATIESYTFISSFFISFIFAFSPKSLLNKQRIWKRIENYFLKFINIFIICWITICCFPNAAVYFMPGEYRTYITQYLITSPGPSLSRHNHCKNGIRIYDEYTSSSFFLCFTPDENTQYGNKALVTIKTTPLGSYLSDYKLFIQH
jgi:hypothetical protein